MRKIIIALSVAITVFSFAIMAQASDIIRIFVNGKEVYSDVAPQVINGRTMVPVRFVAEALGGDVIYDDADKTVY